MKMSKNNMDFKLDSRSLKNSILETRGLLEKLKFDSLGIEVSS